MSLADKSRTTVYYQLVGGLDVVWLPFFIFPYIGFLIIPIDVHIFPRGSNHQPVHLLLEKMKDKKKSKRLQVHGRDVLHILALIFGASVHRNSCSESDVALS